MAANQNDQMNLSSSSTVNLLNENENLTNKYNSYRSQLLNLNLESPKSLAFNQSISIDHINNETIKLSRQLHTFLKHLEARTKDTEMIENFRHILSNNILEGDKLKKLFEDLVESRYQTSKPMNSSKNILDLQKLLNESYSKNELLNEEQRMANIQLNKLSGEIKLLKEELIQSSHESETAKSEIEMLSKHNTELNVKLTRSEKIISVLEIDLENSELKLKDKIGKFEHLQTDFANLQSQILLINSDRQKTTDENKSLQLLVEHYEKERKDLLTKHSSLKEEILKSDTKHAADKHNREKYNLMKKKIVELREQLIKQDAEHQKEKSKTKTIEEEFEKRRRHDEQKFSDQKYHYENIIDQLEKKYMNEIDNLIHQREELIRNIEEENFRTRAMNEEKMINHQTHLESLHERLTEREAMFEALEEKLHKEKLKNESFVLNENKMNKLKQEKEEILQRTKEIESYYIEEFETLERNLKTFKQTQNDQMKLPTLLSSIRKLKSEVWNMKTYYNETVNKIRTELSEIFTKKLTQFIQMIKLEHELKENELKEKFEEHLSAQFRINDRLERENFNLIDEQKKNEEVIDMMSRKLSLNERNFDGPSKNDLRVFCQRIFGLVAQMRIKYKTEIKTIKNDFTKEEHDIEQVISKLKKVYENKVSLLESKIFADEKEILCFKEKNALLNEKMNQDKEKFKNIPEDFGNLEKLLNMKEKKIRELQNMMQHTIISSGVDNIKLANKLDNEVKEIKRKTKLEK